MESENMSNQQIQGDLHNINSEDAVSTTTIVEEDYNPVVENTEPESAVEEYNQIRQDMWSYNPHGDGYYCHVVENAFVNIPNYQEKFMNKTQESVKGLIENYNYNSLNAPTIVDTQVDYGEMSLNSRTQRFALEGAYPPSFYKTSEAVRNSTEWQFFYDNRQCYIYHNNRPATEDEIYEFFELFTPYDDSQQDGQYYDENQQGEYYDQEQQGEYYDDSQQDGQYYDENQQGEYYDQEQQGEYYDDSQQDGQYYDENQQGEYYDQEQQGEYYDENQQNGEYYDDTPAA